MIVCHCHVVNDRAVSDSIERGARTLSQICRATGAGRDCGACIFAVKRLACAHEPRVFTSLPEVEVAAS